MASYRLYFMNTISGHIDRADSFEAETDLEAVRTVRTLHATGPLELWCGTRKLLRLESPISAMVQRYEPHREATSG